MTTAAPHTTEAHHPPSPGTGIHRFLRPGWLRVLWTTPLFFGIGLALVTGFRWLLGWDPIWDGVPIVTVELVTTPLGFLVGLGGFDYWAYYASGRPTVADDHSGHGATSWRDYFRINTDHKVIGIQYVVTTIFFFCAAACSRCSSARSWRIRATSTSTRRPSTSWSPTTRR